MRTISISMWTFYEPILRHRRSLPGERRLFARASRIHDWSRSRNRVGSTGNNARTWRYLINDENEFERFLVEARLRFLFRAVAATRPSSSFTMESALPPREFPVCVDSATRFPISHLCVNERGECMGNPPPRNFDSLSYSGWPSRGEGFALNRPTFYGAFA